MIWTRNTGYYTICVLLIYEQEVYDIRQIWRQNTDSNPSRTCGFRNHDQGQDRKMTSTFMLGWNPFLMRQEWGVSRSRYSSSSLYDRTTILYTLKNKPRKSTTYRIWKICHGRTCSKHTDTGTRIICLKMIETALLIVATASTSSNIAFNFF